ncbi:MAG: carboxypeptidase regulatory-like domain-containing protein [bacterium]
MRNLVVCIIVVCGLCASGRATAQSDAGVRVRGAAFDSLHDKPLVDAFVAIVGGGRTTTTDSRGRFQFDSVPRGSYLITLQHTTLDSLGFPGLAKRVAVSDDNSDVLLAIPSFATLWRNACGESPAPRDSGFVYGTVRDAATNRPVSRAKISVTWYDSIVTRRDADRRSTDLEELDAERRRPNKKREAFPSLPTRAAQLQPVRATEDFFRHDWFLRARSLNDGAYAVCGIPLTSHGIRVHASTDSAASDSIELHMETRVRRRDLRIGAGSASSVAGSGTVAGQLTDKSGAPFPYARVLVAGAAESRADETGHFIIRDVLPGTRRVDVLFIGMAPTHAAADVVSGDTVIVDIRVDRVPALPGMNVRASALGRVIAAEFNARRAIGTGFLVDSIFIARYGSVANVLREAPSLYIRQQGSNLSASVSNGRGGSCTPVVWLDGVEAGYGNLMDLATSEVAGIEVYTQPLTLPAAFVEKGVGYKCGAILVWTKYLFRNR